MIDIFRRYAGEGKRGCIAIKDHPMLSQGFIKTYQLHSVHASVIYRESTVVTTQIYCNAFCLQSYEQLCMWTTSFVIMVTDANTTFSSGIELPYQAQSPLSMVSENMGLEIRNQTRTGPGPKKPVYFQLSSHGQGTSCTL